MWKAASELRCVPAERLEIGGLAAGAPHAEKLGTFVRCFDDTNGRPTYSRETRPNLMIWWGGGRWWLGKREEVGTNRGWLKVASNALTPAEASEGWVVYHAKEKLWMPAEGMHVYNAPLPLKHPDADAAATGGDFYISNHASIREEDCA